MALDSLSPRPVQPPKPEQPSTPEINRQEAKFQELFPEPSVVITAPPVWVWWLILIIGAIGLGFLGYAWWAQRQTTDLANRNAEVAAQFSSPSPTVAPTATPTAVATATPTPTPTATPTAVVAKKLSVRVLNGTTTRTGAAAAMKTLLEGVGGATITSTGNAQTRNYATTTIYYAADQKPLADALAAKIGDGVVLTQSTTIVGSDAAVVVVGLKP